MVAALCVLYNILVNIREITEEDLQEIVDQNRDLDKEDLEEEQQSGMNYHIMRRERTRASVRRDNIANAMWEDYIQFHSQRNRLL